MDEVEMTRSRSLIRVAAPLAPAAVALVVALVAACASQPAMEIPPTKGPPAGSSLSKGVASESAGGPSDGSGATVADARAFMERVEKQVLALFIAAERAEWVKSNFITYDTQRIAAGANEKLMAFIPKVASEAMRFSKLDLPADLARKIKLLRLSVTLPAPSDPQKRTELAQLGTEMEAMYGKGKYCPKGKSRIRGFKKGKCFDLGELSERMAKSRNYDELLEVWKGWRTISRPIRPKYERFVQLANEGARTLGFSDLAALWKSRYDLSPAAFEKEVDRLWKQVKPLYDKLHCYVRSRLRKRYGKRVAQTGPIPAHLLGNMWAQDWANIIDLLAGRNGKSVDVGRALERKRVDEREMVRYGERFFVSLGMTKLPATFWKRSLFVKPRDREVVCHASAWDLDWIDDLRIKMCIKINGEDFTTIHHELGHNYYQYYYRELDPLFRDSANKGFHEGLGDTISLSVTPSYLKKIGLIRRVPRDAIPTLLARALEKVAFLPFGVMIDKWRWDVLAGKVKPSQYNAHWWKLRREYQGIAPPVKRGEQVFDPGAKFHIAANVPYVRYFIAHILQFQFHRALCKAIGHEGPLHTCSIYESKKAGQRLIAMMKMGQSKPWPDALEALTGKREMDASAILAYFQPLAKWLDEQNKGQKCGW